MCQRRDAIESDEAEASMGTVHDLIEVQGKQAVLDLPDFDRSVIETAARYMLDDNADIGFVYSGWCQAALPHKSVPDDTWTFEGKNCSLLVQTLVRNRDSVQDRPGIPYGSRARLILYYMQSQALRNRSREVVLGRNLSDWLKKMNIPLGGKSYTQVQDQCERLAYCHISFNLKSGKHTKLINQPLVDTAMFEDQQEGGRFAGQVRLSERFYEQLLEHDVPLPERAIRSLSNNSMALDVYAWLAYRLWVLEPKEVSLSWHMLKAQFGREYGRLDDFTRRFKSVLDHALAVYREADVTISHGGITLRKSPPPIPRPTKVQGYRLPAMMA